MKRLYALLLYLFPSSYRQEYGDERQAVFDLALDDAMNTGRWVVLRLIIRELIALPGALVYEHLRHGGRANMVGKLSSYFDFTYGSWKEFLTALLPFFLACFAMPLLTYLVRLRFLPLTNKVGPGILLALFGLFILLLILGLMKGLPRWALPYLGFVFSLFSVYIFSLLLMGLIVLAFPWIYDRLLFFGDFFIDGAIWFGLLTVVILIGPLSHRIPVFQQFRHDWTLLCFIVYGAVPFAIMLSFDEYIGDEPYMLVAFLVLALGAWLFLHATDGWRRFGSLFICLTLAMLIVTVGKAILVPYQNWPVHIDPTLARAEAKHTIIMWVWLAIIMFIPLAIKLLPLSDDGSESPNIHGQES